MNILLLSTFEQSGGAAIACKRLMQALHKQRLNVKLLVRDKQTEDKQVYAVHETGIKWKNKVRFLWERLVIWLNNGFSRRDLFAVSIANTGFPIERHPLVEWADIIHLHWVNQGFLSLETIFRLIQSGKPIVWTMHDMWPCTGICHHARDCNAFTTQCGACFFLKSKRKSDLSTKIFTQKRNMVFSDNLITLIGCSRWLAEKAEKSGLSKACNVCSIPNPIDITFFDKKDKVSSRNDLGLPQNKKLILFGAANISDKRKGIDYLFESLHIIKETNIKLFESLHLVVFGQAKTEFVERVNIPVSSMGYLSDREKIVSLYNAVDLFITSSLEENLPNTIMEAMACGTPCVGFEVGGIPEMIDHKENGYVAAYKDANDLANGIHWVLEQADWEHLSRSARAKVEANYSEEVVAKQYMALYHNVLS